MPGAINRYCNSRVINKAMNLSNVGIGFGLGTIFSPKLFNHPEGISTQIMVLALPIIMYSCACLTACLMRRRFVWKPSVFKPYIMGILLANLTMISVWGQSSAWCLDYARCPNRYPNAFSECNRLQKECQEALELVFCPIPIRFAAGAPGNDIHMDSLMKLGRNLLMCTMAFIAIQQR